MQKKWLNSFNLKNDYKLLLYIQFNHRQEVFLFILLSFLFSFSMKCFFSLLIQATVSHLFFLSSTLSVSLFLSPTSCLASYPMVQWACRGAEYTGFPWLLNQSVKTKLMDRSLFKTVSWVNCYILLFLSLFFSWKPRPPTKESPRFRHIQISCSGRASFRSN